MNEYVCKHGEFSGSDYLEFRKGNSGAGRKFLRQDSLSMKIHLFSNKQLFINSQLDTGDSRVLIKRHTDTHVGLTNRLEYHIYSGYTIDKKRTVVLPTTATQYYIGTGFSYNINRKLQLKTGIEYQYNIIYKRWEWVWNSGIRFSF